MSAVEVATSDEDAEAVATDPLDWLGGPDLSLAAKAPPSTRAVIGSLLTELRVACGSLVVGTGGSGRGYLTTEAGSWRTLRECPVYELVEACRRVERAHPGFIPPGSDAQPAHARIGHLLQRLGAE